VMGNRREGDTVWRQANGVDVCLVCVGVTETERWKGPLNWLYCRL
jgi:hypothetical protein